MKKNNLINIILVLVILLNLVIMILLLIDKGKYKKVSEIDIKNYDEFVKVYGNENIGKYYKSFIQKWLEETISSIYTDVKNLDEAGIEEYYNNNSSMLGTSAGIKTYEEFKQLIPALEMYEDIDVKYKKVEVVKKSCMKNGEYTDSVVKIKFEGNKTLKLTVSMIDYQVILRSPGNIDMYKVSLNKE